MRRKFYLKCAAAFTSFWSVTAFSTYKVLLVLIEIAAIISHPGF